MGTGLTPARRVTRFAIILAIKVAALLAAGWTWQHVAEARDDRRYPPPGQRYPVNGRLMHIHCRGTGSPTVIVEQGSGGPSIDWNPLNDQLARITRVCDYDRAGMGYSEPAWTPTRATDVARNLHALLDAARIDDDLVFVAWSAGGIYARQYVRDYPARVRGLVLVDSAHEQALQRMPPQPSNAENLAHLMTRWRLAQVGWLRLDGAIARQYADAPLSSADRERLIAFFLKSHAFHTLADEGVGFEQDLASGMTPPSLGDRPLVVIAEGKPRHPYMQANLARWHELQRELAALSSRGRFVIAANSAHFIHRTEPELIVQAVGDVVGEVRGAAR